MCDFYTMLLITVSKKGHWALRTKKTNCASANQDTDYFIVNSARCEIDKLIAQSSQQLSNFADFTRRDRCYIEAATYSLTH